MSARFVKGFTIDFSAKRTDVPITKAKVFFMSNEYDAVTPLTIPTEHELMERVGWFIKLRWYAGILLISGTLFASYVLKFHLPTVKLCLIGLAIIAYNCLFFYYFRRLGKRPEKRLVAFRRFAHLQVDVDWIVIALIMHNSGGIQSPVLFYFIFHIIIASILLTRRNCYLQATFATILVTLIAFLEYYKVVVPVKLKFMSDLDFLSLSSLLFFFVSTMYIAVFVATSVGEALKSKERNLMTNQAELEDTYHTLAHDLRGPITAMQSMLNTVIAGHGGKISDEAKEWVKRSENRLRCDLLKRVNDTLNWAARRVKLIESVMTDVRLFDIATKAVLNEKEIADDKGVKIVTDFMDQSLTVRGDPDDLGQILAELLHNAVKYTPSEGVVTLSIKTVDDKARIEVADTGIGIPKDELALIFREFYRADNAKLKDRYGTGLGLSIVKQVVDAHAGSISVYSKLGKGTKVVVLLPSSEYERVGETARSNTFLATVESLSGQKLNNCYQCQKCAAGCPVAYAADYTVNQVIRLVQMNQASRALQSSMIWLCTACETCGVRCPNDINMSAVMDALKQLALQEKEMKINEERISAFHSIFLKNIKSNGRIHELGMMAALRLKTGGLFSDLGMAFDMIKKGKLKILPSKVKGIRGIKRIFKTVV
ncbi:TPA: hypothetical protein EYP66_18660 [Candidatus Poribacteria bacterium]|nr:hypothetical protein [Candidatus Poribacteria bacterium]